MINVSSLVGCVLLLTGMCSGMADAAEGRAKAAADGPGRRSPSDGWDFRFKGFVIGAWWGPGATDAEMIAYKEAGFNAAMIGRYMVVDENGVPRYDERFGRPEILAEQLDLCQRHGMWAMLDTYTPNDQPWGGVKGTVDGHPTHHAASLTELKWLCKRFAKRPALLGILLGDDKSALNQRMSAGTDFLRRNHPGIMPWICQNVPNPKGLAEHGNPIFNPQIYPTLYRRSDTAERNALQYCSSYAMMRRARLKYGLLMWPMWNAQGVTGDSLIRFPIYAAIAYGAQGYWSFCYGNNAFMKRGVYKTAADVEKGKTRMYPIVKTANQRVLGWARKLLGSTPVGLLANTWAADTIEPARGQLLEKMSEDVLVGILTKKGQPPLAMIVDARVSRDFRGLPKRDVGVTFNQAAESIVILEGKDGERDRAIDGNVVTLELHAGEGQLVAIKGGSELQSVLPKLVSR